MTWKKLEEEPAKRDLNAILTSKKLTEQKKLELLCDIALSLRRIAVGLEDATIAYVKHR
jgi:hypothetical protein